MRELTLNEVESVSGALSFFISAGRHGLTGGVSVTGSDILSAHNWAVSEATKFFEWWDPAGYYEDSVAGVTL